MSVYFVYRSHYEGRSEKHVKRFDDATVLEWFRNRWTPLADEDTAEEHARRLLGCNVYSFARLFVRIAENNTPAPHTARELEGYLQGYLYVNEMTCSRNLVQILTDDDELEMAAYFFDDHFLEKHGKLAAFLLHEDWRLPVGEGAGGFRTAEPTAELLPRGRGTGATYLAFLSCEDSSNLSDLAGVCRFRGVRLPDLCRHLMQHLLWGAWTGELLLLGEALLKGIEVPRAEEPFLRAVREDPGDEAAWLVYSDWLEERGHARAGSHLLAKALAHIRLDRLDAPTHDPKKFQVNAGEHLAQLSLHTMRVPKDQADLYDQWIFFDDLWASAHPDLANGVLRFASRWDVLSPGRERDEP
jgi:uncharacterized protein (TIGR02996 family)